MMNEQAYLDGRASAAREMLIVLRRMLPMDERTVEEVRSDLSEAAQALRRLYEDATGAAAPWPENLYLVDVIDKYIAPLIGPAS